MRNIRAKSLPATDRMINDRPGDLTARDSGLTVLLAAQVMGWVIAPDRFLLDNRRWLPRWRFQPDQNLTDAFRLLDEAKPEQYAMGSAEGGEFWVHVDIAGRVGKARHVSRPRAITFAIARALGLDPEEIS